MAEVLTDLLDLDSHIIGGSFEAQKFAKLIIHTEIKNRKIHDKITA